MVMCGAGLTGMLRSAPKTFGGCTGRPPSGAPPASLAASSWGGSSLSLTRPYSFPPTAPPSTSCMYSLTAKVPPPPPPQSISPPSSQATPTHAVSKVLCAESRCDMLPLYRVSCSRYSPYQPCCTLPHDVLALFSSLSLP